LQRRSGTILLTSWLMGLLTGPHLQSALVSLCGAQKWIECVKDLPDVVL
jgi:hypothetical protein